MFFIAYCFKICVVWDYSNSTLKDKQTINRGPHLKGYKTEIKILDESWVSLRWLGFEQPASDGALNYV